MNIFFIQIIGSNILEYIREEKFANFLKSNRLNVLQVYGNHLNCSDITPFQWLLQNKPLFQNQLRGAVCSDGTDFWDLSSGDNETESSTNQTTTYTTTQTTTQSTTQTTIIQTNPQTKPQTTTETTTVTTTQTTTQITIETTTQTTTQKSSQIAPQTALQTIS